MPTFPTNEVDILAAAWRMYKGLLSHRPDFPHLKMNVMLKYVYFRKARQEQIIAQGLAQVASENKQDALTKLAATMKNAIKAAEVDCAACPEKLAYIGWSAGRKPRKAEIPAAPVELQLMMVDKQTIELNWKRPPDESRVRNYIVYARKTGADWQMLTVTTTTSVQLDLAEVEKQLQSRLCGVSTEYTVAAVTTAGAGPMSNLAGGK